MSLQTDIIFVRAIRSNQSIIEALPAGDVYNIAIALPEPDAYNAPLPYIIVTFDSMTNDISTKDGYEGDYDNVQIGIEVAAKTRPQLCSLMEAIRTTIREFFEDISPSDNDFSLVPLDYQLSASAIQYDDMKPCYWQTLNYSCDVNA